MASVTGKTYVDTLSNRKPRNTYMSLVDAMTPNERGAMKRANRLKVCEYGHYECSTVWCGPCFDELTSKFGE